LGRTLSIGTQADRYGDFQLSEIVPTGMGQPGETEITAPSVTVTVTVYGKWQLVQRQ
jgi:hypothetical protein